MTDRDLRRGGRLAATLLAAGMVLGAAACGGDGVSTPDKDTGGVDAPDVTFVEVKDGAGEDTDTAEPPEVTADTDAAVGVDSDAAGETTTGPQPGEYLHPCDGPEDCFSGFCVDSPQGEICSKTCDGGGSCLAGWSCSQVGAGGDPQFICIPNDTYLCRPCQDDDDCNTPGYPKTGVCVNVGEVGSFCSRTCDANAACPGGFQCSAIKPYGETGPTLDLCVADSVDACSCTPKFVKEGAKTTCFRESQYGVCYGETICAEVGPLPACSAPEPVQETCNGIDDDCDGETDEEAADCTTYYLDSDGDNYGQGLGECLCTKPGNKWLEQGGDCNELVTSINPGAQEACNGLDDDCDGETDEAGAFGCITQYEDKDGDLYGKTDVTACFCSGADGWAPDPNDCNDLNPLVNPGAEETCDGIDNDCDTAIDETGALGCKIFFLDQDGDGYGVTESSKCLCGPTGAFIGSKPGDCNDVKENAGKSVNPGVPELCNGVDDNCDGDTDEGDPSSMCPNVASGTAGCVNGKCGLVDCEPGWSDADGDPLNGCECPDGSLELPGGVGDSCQAPQTLGLLQDNGAQQTVTDNISPEGDEDWYRFTAVDGADPGGCDTFDVRIDFVHNPGEQFVFDVYEGGCALSQNVCAQSLQFSSSTNLLTTTPTGLVGECPCVAQGDTAEGVQKCSDQTEVYIVRVYRKPGLAGSCAAYTLRMRNGP